MKERILGAIAAVVIGTLRGLLRVRHANEANIAALNRSARGYIMAFWHAHLLLMVFAAYRRPITAVISQHRDGELIAQTVGWFGARAARGSTTRGGSAALREVIRILTGGGVVAITPDGPRGPRRVAQLGAITAAQAAQAPIVPVAFTAKKKSF